MKLGRKTVRGQGSKGIRKKGFVLVIERIDITGEPITAVVQMNLFDDMMRKKITAGDRLCLHCSCVLELPFG